MRCADQASWDLAPETGPVAFLPRAGERPVTWNQGGFRFPGEKLQDFSFLPTFEDNWKKTKQNKTEQNTNIHKLSGRPQILQLTSMKEAHFKALSAPESPGGPG